MASHFVVPALFNYLHVRKVLQRTSRVPPAPIVPYTMATGPRPEGHPKGDSLWWREGGGWGTPGRAAPARCRVAAAGRLG